VIQQMCLWEKLIKDINCYYVDIAYRGQYLLTRIIHFTDFRMVGWWDKPTFSLNISECLLLFFFLLSCEGFKSFANYSWYEPSWRWARRKHFIFMLLHNVIHLRPHKIERVTNSLWKAISWLFGHRQWKGKQNFHAL